MLKDLFKQIKNRILAKENMANPDSSTYISIKQNGKTYNLYDLPDGFMIKGNVDLSNKGLTKLPDLSKVIVEGHFSCSDNQLTSLAGAPLEVGGHFNCRNNQLTSLQGAPQKVGGSFNCRINQLTSLAGSPQKVGGDFICNNNKLTSLTGAPREVGGDFECSDNQLKNLQGASQKVGGEFWCDNNHLTSLQGAPQEVGGDFLCYNNQLTTLIGAPKEVSGNFYCSNNDNLFSLFGLPQMQEDKGIYCDDDLMERYNCLKKEDEYNYYYIEYKDLIESAKYQSELSVYKIRQKKHEEKKESQAKLKAEFEAFMKMQTEERE